MSVNAEMFAALRVGQSIAAATLRPTLREARNDAAELQDRGVKAIIVKVAVTIGEYAGVDS